jgi:hypothetical protein
MTIPKPTSQSNGLSTIADTQPKFTILAISGGVWLPAPVSERPEIVLADWHVFEVQLPGLDARTRHFAGQNMTDREGRTSSAIVTFDAATGRGVTQSGRVYQLIGGTGLRGDREYTWNRWKSINKAADVVDVTAEIENLMADQ